MSPTSICTDALSKHQRPEILCLKYFILSSFAEIDWRNTRATAVFPIPVKNPWNTTTWRPEEKPTSTPESGGRLQPPRRRGKFKLSAHGKTAALRLRRGETADCTGLIYLTLWRLKGTCHEIFDFWFFSWINFSQAPEYTTRPVSNFFENSQRYSQLKVDHRCRWHRWQMKKIFNQKNCNNFVGTPLDSN